MKPLETFDNIRAYLATIPEQKHYVLRCGNEIYEALRRIAEPNPTFYTLSMLHVADIIVDDKNGPWYWKLELNGFPVLEFVPMAELRHEGEDSHGGVLIDHTKIKPLLPPQWRWTE